MSQSNEHINPIKIPIRPNKNFVYKGKKYPVDFCVVKKFSNFFNDNRKSFKSISDIEIIPENCDIKEESVPMFVACCQSQPFDINDSNVFSLYQLSIQYKVPVLNDFSSQYIKKNPKPIVFESIFFKLNNINSNSNAKLDLSVEEELIASNFFEFINDERLLLLPIHVLYQIINSKHLHINSMDLSNQNQIIEFLFKCLDKYKREASILFLNLDLENERIDLLPRLLAHYSNIFDFNFINPKFLAKNTSSILGQLKSLQIEFMNKLDEMQNENKKQQELLTISQNSFNELKNDMEKRLTNLEVKMDEQAKKLERYTRIKVSKIEIISEPKIFGLGSTITLSALIKPEIAFNDSVEWKIIQEERNLVEVISKNEKSLVLKGLIPSKKVTVIAESLDGSGVKEKKELNIGSLKGTIEINNQQDQMINGRIKIIEEGGVTMDKSKSKYILNSNDSSKLGIDAYESGSSLDSLSKEFSFSVSEGIYYLHVLIVDNLGYPQEIKSKKMIVMDNNLKERTIKEIKERIHNEIGDCINLPKVMIIGQCGSGKTTLSIALAGFNLKVEKGKGNRAVLSYKDIINHGSISITSFPSFYVDGQKRFAMVEISQTDDICENQQRLINSFTVDYLFHENTSVILLAVSDNELMPNNQRLIHDIENIEEMFEDYSQLKKRFAIVITKSSQEMDDDDCTDILSECVKKRKLMELISCIHVYKMPKVSKKDIGSEYAFKDKERIIDFISSNISK